MQFDDGKIRPKHLVTASALLLAVCALTMVAKASKVTSDPTIVKNADKTMSMTYELQLEDIDEAELTVQINSLETMQDKCNKTGITCEIKEVPKGLHFNPEDVSQPSNMTIEQLESFTVKYCPEWVGLEEYILTLDDQVNLIFLLSVARIETWAGSATVGDYNCFNIRHSNGDYCDYTSHTESIDHFVRLITREYLNPEGSWYEGVSIYAIGIHYAQEKWAPGVTDLGYEIYEYML